MARKAVTFDNWDAGEYGTLDTAAPKGSFTASNMLRFIDGSIGPRPGLYEAPVTGIPAGLVRGFGKGETATSAYVIVGTTVYGVDTANGGAAITYTGSLAVQPTIAVRETVDSPKNFTWITNFGDKSYELNHVAHTVTALTGSPGGHTIAIYGTRLVVGNMGATPQRIQWSAAGDYSTWPARNYLDVGDAATILSLHVVRNTLMIGKESTWWQMTGVPGVNDAVRQRLRSLHEVSSHQERGTVSNGVVWFQPIDGDYPASFNGTGVRELRHLSLDTGYDSTSIPPASWFTGMKRTDEYAFFSETAGLVHRNGAWTRHDLGVTPAWVMSMPPGANLGRLAFCDGGGASAAAKFYLWEYDLDRPVLSTDAMCSAGDGTTTPVNATVSVPEWWEPHGLDVRVHTVVVDFVSYATGNSATNHFDLTVNCLRRYAQGGDQVSDTQTYDEAAALSSASGTEQRQQFNFGEQLTGAGFQVTAAAVRGIKIKRITVLYDELALTGAR